MQTVELVKLFGTKVAKFSSACALKELVELSLNFQPTQRINESDILGRSATSDPKQRVFPVGAPGWSKESRNVVLG